MRDGLMISIGNMMKPIHHGGSGAKNHVAAIPSWCLDSGNAPRSSAQPSVTLMLSSAPPPG
jgi:hypothetical protein